MGNIVKGKIKKLAKPGCLDNATRRCIKEMYYAAIEEMGEDEFKYIINKIDDKLIITCNSQTQWVAELSKYYEALWLALKAQIEGLVDLSPIGIKYISAALFYFINPFDIIPDYTPGIGYIDDLLVLSLCINKLSVNDRREIDRLFIKHCNTH